MLKLMLEQKLIISVDYYSRLFKQSPDITPHYVPQNRMERPKRVVVVSDRRLKRYWGNEILLASFVVDKLTVSETPAKLSRQNEDLTKAIGRAIALCSNVQLSSELQSGQTKP